MKPNPLFFKLLLFVFVIAALPKIGIAQTYDLVDYYINGTPTNGVKIKTNIPFQNGGSMPTIHIEGYNYGLSAPIGLDIVWYVYNNSFIHAAVSSRGAYTPQVYLSEENGLITLFIDARSYFQRFHISAYAKGLSAENTASFSGWTVADDSLSGNHQLLVPYRNSFKGIITVDGNLLVGKTSQTNSSYKLDVNGNIRANKVVVNTTGADYVFDSTYRLPELDSLDGYIRKYHHLPGVLPAGQMQREGLDVGDNQAILLQKIEELTLYVIRQNKFILEQQIAMKKLSTEVAALKKQAGQEDKR